MDTTTITRRSKSFFRNVYRYSILSLLVLLILIVGCHNNITQLILITLLLILIVILFEVFTASDVNVNVEKIEPMENIRGETFLDMNIPSPALLPLSETTTMDDITLPGNEVTCDVPFDPRGLRIKKSANNMLPPIDIDYDVAIETNFVPNNLQIGGGGDRYDYLHRGYMYEDMPGNVIQEQYDDLIISLNFGKFGYFVNNDCNFRTVDTLLN